MRRTTIIAISVILGVVLGVLLVGTALARPSIERAPDGTYLFCSNVYHDGERIAKVCVAWNISTSGDLVRANTNGTRSVQFFKSGYSAVLGPQSCVPYQVWATSVTCNSKTTFKEGKWQIGGIKQTCVFTPGLMVCSVRKILAEPEAG